MHARNGSQPGIPVNKRHRDGGRGSYRRGEVYFIRNLPFEGTDGAKDRPVVCVSDSGGSIRCMRCTSSDSGRQPKYQILDPLSAGLDKASYVDPKIITVSKEKVVRLMGELNPVDYENLGLDSMDRRAQGF
jgi:mRNA-degrading endonuclease toxin of MazEF toxin-antitoxin module